MKSLKTVALVLLVLLVAASSLWAYPRTPIIEYFSEYGCGPCAAQHEPILSMLDTYSRDEISFIVYHVWWPAGGDPYYTANVAENTARANYYGVSSVPMFQGDGDVASANPLSGVLPTVSGRIGQETPYYIDLSADISGPDINISSTVIADSATGTDVTLRIALVEVNGLGHPGMPGSNGIADYRYNMIDMVPDAVGSDVSSTAGADTFHFDFSIPWETEYEIGNYGVIAWVQDNTSQLAQQSKYVLITADHPNLMVEDMRVFDENEATPNGRLDPGETAEFAFDLHNLQGFDSAYNLTGSLSCDDPDVNISDASGSWGSFAADSSVTNDADPFTLSIGGDYSASYVTFSLALSDDSSYADTLSWTALVGWPEVFLVNDYGVGLDASGFWESFAISSDLTTDIRPNEAETLAMLPDYELVLWTTSSDYTALSADEQSAIASYLDGGGRLLLTGENVPENADSTWLADYFGVTAGLSAQSGVDALQVTGHPDGPFALADMVVLAGSSGADNSSVPSSVVPMSGTTPLLQYGVGPEVAATAYYGGDFSTLLVGFNMEAAANTGTLNGAELFAALVNQLSGLNTVPGVGSSALPHEVSLAAWPNPFNAELSLRYALPKSGEVSVQVFDLLGRQVASLASGQQAAGNYQLHWNASDVPSGSYLIRLNLGNESRVQRVTLVK